MSTEETSEQTQDAQRPAETPSAQVSDGASADQPRARALTLLSLGALITVWLDQWSKRWALEALYLKVKAGEAVVAPADAAALYSRNIEVTSWFNFHLVGNKGAAWGIFKNLPEQWRVLFFAVLTIVALGMMFMMYLQSNGQRLMRFALLLIIGGAIGNFIDRLTIGYVIDFIDWHYGGKHWPTFNVADVWISVGVGLMLVDMIRQSLQGEREERPAQPES